MKNIINPINPSELPKGLIYIPDYITSLVENELISFIDSQEWSNELIRRVQHYGYKYDYKNKLIKKDSYLGELPNIFHSIGEQLFSADLINKIPNQAIINEYLSNQGIARHYDCKPCFDNSIVSISLLNPIVMEFEKVENKYLSLSHRNNKISLVLEPRSALILSGDARNNWYHSITPRKSDMINNVNIQRSRRVSITFRKVILS